MKAEFKDICPYDAEHFVRDIINTFALKGEDLTTLERIIDEHEMPVTLWTYVDSTDAPIECGPKFKHD